MKKGGPAPVAKSHQKHETVSASTSTQAKSGDPSLTKAEIGAIVEKTVSEALARQMSEFQSDITKSTKQQEQAVSDRLRELGDKCLDANAKNVKHIKEVEDAINALNLRCGLLEKLVKEELDAIVEEKVRLILQKTRPDSGLDEEKKKWSEQLARSESIHQEEIQKLHQQHHQDMLSVIQDCCRKLKTGFTRQNKPYDVGEIHVIIDDTEQKMVREILSEIEKTDTHEDLSSFAESNQFKASSLTTSELSHEVGQGREFSQLSSDEIAASLDAFDSENLGNFSEDLESMADAVAAADAGREPAVEENISASRSMITGDRGNIYYAEELKRTIDDMIAIGGGATDVNPSETGSAPELPPKTVDRSQSEVEASLESLIVSGDDEAVRFQTDFKGVVDKDQKETKKTVAAAVDDSKLGWQSKTSDILPETTNLDPDLLKSLEAEVEGDFSWTDIQPSLKIEPKELQSGEAVIQPVSATSAKSPQAQDQVRPVEGKKELDHSVESAQERDQMKALEEMLEAQMTDSLDTKGKNISLEHLEPTKSAKQQVKANVSEQVTSSALQSTETIKVTPKTGYDENPHYVEEVLKASASSAKDKP